MWVLSLKSISLKSYTSNLKDTFKVYHAIHPDNTKRRGSAGIKNESINHYQEIDYQTDYIQAT